MRWYHVPLVILGLLVTAIAVHLTVLLSDALGLHPTIGGCLGLAVLVTIVTLLGKYFPIGS